MKTILLDGLFGAPWRLNGLRRSLEKRGIGPVRVFAYNSTGTRPLEELAAELREFSGEEPVQIAAHSMGGLITRTAKCLFPDWNVQKVVFLCVPHHGSLMANLLPFTGVRQMRPGSDLMKQLASQEWTIPTLSVWCPGDLLVLPGSSARWPKAQQEIRCDFPLHNWPVVSPFFHRCVGDFFSDRASNPEPLPL